LFVLPLMVFWRSRKPKLSPTKTKPVKIDQTR
jgi:hypothetical protein